MQNGNSYFIYLSYLLRNSYTSPCHSIYFTKSLNILHNDHRLFLLGHSLQCSMLFIIIIRFLRKNHKEGYNSYYAKLFLLPFLFILYTVQSMIFTMSFICLTKSLNILYHVRRLFLLVFSLQFYHLIPYVLLRAW